MRATSKASYLDLKESGAELSQSNKILEIISIGGDWSMQEILAAFRVKYGPIELSSVSARCNNLKSTEKIKEGPPRKCSLTNKTIHPLIQERVRGLGEWQAWVEQGKTKKDQLARFKKVPEEMKARVASHMKLVIALQKTRGL